MLRVDPRLIDKARQIALILVPEPKNGMGDNKIFLTQARDLICWCLVHLAIKEAETGELCCNLPYLCAVLGGSDVDFQSFLAEMRRCDYLNGSVRRAGERFAGKMKRSPKTAESILTEAQSALQLYDPATELGQRIMFSDFDPADLKNPKTPTTVHIVIPPEFTETHGQFAGLCLNAMIDTCIEADRFEPRVTIVGDEWAAAGYVPSALPTLKMGRSRGVQLISYVQDTESYGSIYGRDGSLFTTQAEIVLAWGIRSTDDAEEYSKRAGMLSEVTESTSLPASDNEDKACPLSLSEKGISAMRPDEFLHLPRFTAVMFYGENLPVTLDLVSYRSVPSWSAHATPMPGAPPLKNISAKYKA